ncbi:MAG: hypothetical protein ACR2OZ_16580 [Verrucomicrobiales bacterium]
MTDFMRKYGRIALALIIIFLSGQGVGWMLASRSCHGNPAPAPTDSQEWSGQMLARLTDDLDLREQQAAPVRARLNETSLKMAQERDRAMFRIYLQLFKLHDDLTPEIDAKQKIRLDRSRKALLQSIKQRFPQFLSDPALAPELKPSDELPPP